MTNKIKLRCCSTGTTLIKFKKFCSENGIDLVFTSNDRGVTQILIDQEDLNFIGLIKKDFYICSYKNSEFYFAKINVNRYNYDFIL